ncbi:M14 family metallopeptidase [Novispirillum itersonii]|uniref:DUF2817 domain-containing protein n=1 Tax=Novispirillum itersonii TaxID=189 RepID=A0A7W9ZEQ3_NOVIT|nr:M14 family metallopeptidase [Novispirillum itersonii]MBB6210128.1 hypothetical protein [Novispirillum itersonii]
MLCDARADNIYYTASLAAFADDYAQARREFLFAVDGQGLSAGHHRHPLAGPVAEALACDTVWIGPRAARRVLVVISGTHGVEGFAGSAVQTDWLLGKGPSSLPDGCAVLLVHGINPWGFAWLRRTTEDGVDLNRNFVDFSAPLPQDEGYAELADALIPEALIGEPVFGAQDALDRYKLLHGQRAYENALTSGQYTHPLGLFYGGDAPTWSRRTLETIAQDYDLAGRAALCVIDLHTGLGPFGYGELISDHQPESRSAWLARRWFGQSVTEAFLGTSTSGPKRGLADYFWHGLIEDHGCMLTLEFGTYPFDDVFGALRADHWLHARVAKGEQALDWYDPDVQAVKKRIRRAFYPDTPDWKEMVLFRGRQVLRQAVTGLAVWPG